MNDVTATEGDTDMFRKEYEAVVKQIQEEIPDAHIFVNSVFSRTGESSDRRT